MSEKEEKILQEIISFVKVNKTMPSIRFIQEKLNYKSANSVYQYFNSLEKKGYLIRNNYNKLIINQLLIYNENIKKVKIINLKNTYIELVLNKKNNYLGYKITNNFFNNFGILKGDILIIQKGKALKNNDFGLFIINNKPRVMIYYYQNGFYVLKDNETIILNKVNIIGKLMQVIRKI